MRVTLRHVALLLAFVGACGGPGNSLSGSIGESFSLDFDSAQIRKQDLDLIVEYLKKQNGGTNKVAKIVVDTQDLVIDSSTVIRGDLFNQKVTVSRVTMAGGDFPPLKSGSIRFSDWNFKNGGRVAGEFDVLFTNGRTLSGNFENDVQEVSTN